MKKFRKALAAILLVFALLINVVSCIPGLDNGDDAGQIQSDDRFYFDSPLTVDMAVGESLTLTLIKGEGLSGDVVWTSSNGCATVEEGVVTAVSEGVAVIKATLGSKVARVVINVKAEEEEEYVFGSEYSCITISEAMLLAEEWTGGSSDESYYIIARIDYLADDSKGEMYISDDTGIFYVYKSSYDGGLSISETDLATGDMIVICGTLRNYKGLLEIDRGTILNHYTPGVDTPTRPGQGNSGDGDGNEVVVPGVDDPIQSDPYVNVDEDEFYANYTPAISYMDAYYRTKHNLMSGSIADQDQAPTISAYQPRSNGKLIRNNLYLFSEDGNTYYVVDAYGEVVMEIYESGAYVVLEEVAAYVFAFGKPPANQSSSKNTEPTESAWGEYLRLNNTKFSGDTSRYPYEPKLPRISGCGGDLTYYEMDIGTTGTDCDPAYTAEPYNNGYYITRGAARIVYSCKDRNGNNIIDLDERYVFYTYNHYNDFQEYLNYYGGWGEMFGNITGGGSISSKYDYNPTDYVEVVRASLKPVAVTVVYYYVPSKEYTL